MEIRLYESWQDENMDTDCCECNTVPGLFVMDFGNYKTTVCENCIDDLIHKLEECKKFKICGYCNHRKRLGFSFKCSCGKSKNWNQEACYYEKACEYFKREGEDNGNN